MCHVPTWSTDKQTDLEMVYFVITGFGNFAGVKDNPTEHIAKNIEDFIHARKKSLPDESQIYSSTPLKVSAEAVGQWLTQAAEEVHKALPDTAEVVWVSTRQGLIPNRHVQFPTSDHGSHACTTWHWWHHAGTLSCV